LILDPLTLAVAYVLLSSVLGVLLLFAWTRNRKVDALAWWSGTFCLTPVGIGMANLGQAPSALTFLIANACVALAYGFLYAGCKSFNGRLGLGPASLIGPAIWILAFPLVGETFGARLLLASVIFGGYAALSSWELWKHAPQRLVSQQAAVVLLLLLAGLNGFRAAVGLSLLSILSIDVSASRWSTEMALFLVVNAPALAFTLLAMAKERIAFDYRRTVRALREQERQLATVFNQTIVGILHRGLRNDVLMVNQRFCDIVGRTREQLDGLSMEDITYPEDRAQSHTLYQQHRRHGTPYQVEKRYIRPDGTAIWCAVNISFVHDGSGQVSSIIAVAEDIQERKQAEEHSRESEEHYRYSVELNPQVPWTADPQGNILDASSRWFEQTGIPVKEALGSGWLKALHPDDVVPTQQRWMRSISSGEPFDTAYRVRLADGNYYWARARASARRDADGRILRWYGAVEDIHDKKLVEERLRRAAYHDDLTDLPNRRLFHERLREALASTSSPECRVGVLVMDLDHLKQINDQFGHDAGDVLLQEFSNRLRAVVRTTDTVARLGGDEFAVILTDVAGESNVAAVAHAIVARMKEPFRYHDQSLACRTSIGGTISIQSDKGAEDAGDLLKRADLALYSCKAAGRGMFEMFRPAMREVAQKTASALKVARQAVAHEWIEPFYQPKVDLGSGRPEGFEALLRWRHPRLGIQSPDTLSPAFDDMELGVVIGMRMLSRVVDDMRRWLDAGLEIGKVSINASSADFRRADYAQRVLEHLREAGIPPGHFEVEVTETVFLDHNVESLQKTLRTLSEGGVSIALDDFGTGYASLSHLKQFPVNVLKIDRSFVSDMETDTGDAAIVRAVLSLGQSLGIRVVAEGVETAAQAAFLQEHGCDLGQGYHFGRPMPAGEVQHFISAFGPTTFGRLKQLTLRATTPIKRQP
jgi:diguanylate cyclase (GGDEF)-like protein/PAS domain S-box-containing protein